MAELLPCPFCGGKAYLENHHRAFIKGETTIVTLVRCTVCNARSGRVKLSDFGRTSRSEEAYRLVVKMWNTRTPQKKVTAESAISALQKAAQNIENMNPDDYIGLQINPTMIETRQCPKYNERGETNGEKP